MECNRARFCCEVEAKERTGYWSDLKRLPTVVNMVLLCLLLISVWNLPILGFNMTGIAWVVPCAFSLLVISRNFDKVTFPFALWLPWVVLLLGYLALVDTSLLDRRVIPAQRTVQMLCPLFVGMAASTWRPTVADLRAFLDTSRRVAFLLLVVAGFTTGILLSGILPGALDMAPQAITVTLLCTLFANSCMLARSRKDLLLWGALTLIPVIALTRTAIVVSLLTFPLSFCPMRMSRRLVSIAFIAVAALLIFNTERVQKKMFFSGKGTFEDICERRENFATSGRSYMWEKMGAAVEDEYLTGHGSGMGETFTYGITRNIAYPHNDWLLMQYDYGLVGTVIFLVCILLTMIHALVQTRHCSDDAIKLLLLTGSAGFMPFMLLMFTDNITVYVSFFGNLHYVILGLGYAALRQKQISGHQWNMAYNVE